MVMPNVDSTYLSFGDALFLYFEREGQPINVASVALFEGVVRLEDCIAFIESKLPLIPRYRQRLVIPPMNLGVPMWAYDPNFDIRNHVREIVLKRGTEAELKSRAAEILSTTLNRERPLWDFTLLRGLKGNRTGAVVRLHHSLADGISGVGLINVLMDPSPNVPVLAPQRNEPKHPPQPEPNAAAALLEGIIDTCLSTVQRVLTAQTELLTFAQQIAVGSTQQAPANSNASGETPVPSVEALTRLMPDLASLTDRLPFNIVCRGPQKFEWTDISITEMKAVKNACGSTLNDVILTVVAAAIRRYSELHGVPLENRTLRVAIPVNIRGNGDVSELGNRITFLPMSIPLDIREPHKLIVAVREAMAQLRSARVGEIVGFVGTMVTTIPSPLQAILGPIVSQLPLNLINTIITNVPGPQNPLYLIGHKMLACYPYVPIGGEMGMNCAVLSYDGKVFFGFTGDVHAIPDLEKLPKFVDASFQEMRKAVGVVKPRPKTAKRKRKVAAPAVTVVPPEPSERVAHPTSGANDKTDIHEERVRQAAGGAS
jgi:diacylglycerol O-acyltransferase